MDYPVWQVSFGANWLIALIATVHVFVSHFAIGGGLFLVLMEGSAQRHDDGGLRLWLRVHSRFFLLLTLVFGALTGVGIWFTIGLVSPVATAHLIRLFMWAWAVEWVFFVVEILAILVYYYTWDRLDTVRHRAVGWIYFGAAWASLAVINGILAFQLTPGRYPETGALRHAFFNPSYLSSTLVRTLICVALAGLYALASLAWSRITRPDLVKRAVYWLVAPMVLLPGAVWWYLKTVPSGQLVAFGEIRYAGVVAEWVLAVSALLLAFAATCWVMARQKWYLRLASVLMMALGFLAFFFTEQVREALRKPYILAGSVWTNQVPVDHLEALKAKGVLPQTYWASVPAVNHDNRLKAGEELFRLLCSTCHTVDKGPLALSRKLTQLDPPFAEALVQRTELMRGRMPPFPGTVEEARAVAYYLRNTTFPTKPPASGRAVFRRRCAQCHTLTGALRPLAPSLGGSSAADIQEMIGMLGADDAPMPPWTGPEEDLQQLSDYLAKELPKAGAP